MIKLTDKEFRQITIFIRENYGINLEKKRALIEGRLGFYVTSNGFQNYGEYFNYAINDPTKEELTNLLNRITTNHTFFMREEDHFEYYKDHVLPWVEHDLGTKDLRVWSAGCSTGQEPYVISMVTQDYIGPDGKSDWDATILASDISNKALATAKNGVYHKNDIQDMPKLWKKKYFSKINEENVRVTKELRRSIAFRNINLLDDFTFKKPLHAIFCRNVMIYFDEPTKKEIIKKFHRVLAPGGYFFLGHSESLSALSHDFVYIRPSVYRKD